jgi:hypothetical protein
VCFVNQGADRECAELTACADDHWISVVHTATSDRTCAPHTVRVEGKQYETVAAGTNNDRECDALTECNTNQWIGVAHTATSDRTCTDHTVCVTAN